MSQTRSSIFNAIPAPMQRPLVWSLAIGAALVPLLYEQYLDGGNGKQTSDLALQNRAAIALFRYQSAGRMVIAGTDGHRKLDLKVPSSDWENFKPAERGALERRVAGVVLRGIPIESYVIRDDAGKILAMGPSDSLRG